MVDRRRHGAPPLLKPYATHPEAPASATFLQHALQASYVAAQTQGRMIGTITWPDRHWVEESTSATPSLRIIQATDWESVFIIRAHVPPYATSIGCTTAYTAYGGSGIPALVYHRLTLIDSAGPTTIMGPVRYDQIDTSSRYDPIATAEFQDVTNGVFTVYDQGVHRGGVYCRLDGADGTTALDLGATNIIVIALQAFAVDARGISVQASESSRNGSNGVSALVPDNHGFTAGINIWTEGFDQDVSSGTPTTVTSVTENTINWTLAGCADADFGAGTIYSANGTPLPYRPAAYSVWYEVGA